MNLLGKTMIAASFALTGLAASVGTSSAMNVAPLAPGASPLVQDVRWGCGPGWQPNRWGRCVPVRRPYYGYGGGYGWGGGWGPRPRWGWGDGGGWRHHRGGWDRPYYRERRWDDD